MTQTKTLTTTYTKVDVDKTFESFRSDLRLISMSSGCSVDNVDVRADDVLAYANAGYIHAVNVILHDKGGTRIQAAKYTVNEQASGWNTEGPGNNFWPKTPDGALGLLLEPNRKWNDLSQAQKAEFRTSLHLPWPKSGEDTSFSDMSSGSSRRYASNAYGLEQQTFTKR